MSKTKKINLLVLVIISITLVGCLGKKENIVYNQGEAVNSGTQDTASEYANSQDKTTEQGYSEVLGTSTEEYDANSYAVYICGAVLYPGVYYMEAGSIKQDVLDAAGGFTEDAVTWYVNLAEEITKGEKIYVPYEEELELGITPLADNDTSTSESSLVNINTADKQKLMTLPGIGESKANSIIAYREQNGAFSCTEDICRVDGIKEGLYNKIKDLITVN